MKIEGNYIKRKIKNFINYTVEFDILEQSKRS